MPRGRRRADPGGEPVRDHRPVGVGGVEDDGLRAEGRDDELPGVGGELGDHARVGQRHGHPQRGAGGIRDVDQAEVGAGVAAHGEGAAVGAERVGHHDAGGDGQARDRPGGGSVGRGEHLHAAVRQARVDDPPVGGHRPGAGEPGVVAGDDAAGLARDGTGGVDDGVVHLRGGDAEDPGGPVLRRGGLGDRVGLRRGPEAPQRPEPDQAVDRVRHQVGVGEPDAGRDLRGG